MSFREYHEREDAGILALLLLAGHIDWARSQSGHHRCPNAAHLKFEFPRVAAPIVRPGHRLPLKKDKARMHLATQTSPGLLVSKHVLPRSPAGSPRTSVRLLVPRPKRRPDLLPLILLSCIFFSVSGKLALRGPCASSIAHCPLRPGLLAYYSFLALQLA